MAFEILAVDNGSRDGSTEVLRSYEADTHGIVRPFFLSDNFGTTVSRNVALREARGRWICIMDSDVEVQPGTVQVLVAALGEASSIGLVAPKILYPSGTWQKSTDRFPTVGHKLNRLLRLKEIEKRESERALGDTKSRDVDYAISAFWIFRRKILETVGLLDEKIFYAPEDVDYCIRVWRAGYRVVYVPSVHVVHHAQEISRGWTLSPAKISHLKGLVYLFTKHGYFFRPPAFRH